MHRLGPTQPSAGRDEANILQKTRLVICSPKNYLCTMFKHGLCKRKHVKYIVFVGALLDLLAYQPEVEASGKFHPTPQSPSQHLVTIGFL